MHSPYHLPRCLVGLNFDVLIEIAHFVLPAPALKVMELAEGELDVILVCTEEAAASVRINLLGPACGKSPRLTVG